MKYIVSRYNNDVSWLKDYTDDVVIYDRSEKPVEDSIVVPNIGTDLYDKFTYIIDNYDNLPDVAVYTKANLFKYMPKEEFDLVKDNTTFTPLHTMKHKTYLPVCWYENGMYAESNDYWYLNPHPAMFAPILLDIFKMRGRYYNLFSPGSNYILTREDIQRHPKSLYEKIRACLDWDVYPGDAQICERNLYYLWGTDILKEKHE